MTTTTSSPPRSISATNFEAPTIDVDAKVVRHGRYIMAEVAIPGPLFAEILRLIDGLAPRRLSCYASWQPPGVIWAISGKSNWRY
jgi:hypothetical protein